MIWAILVLLGVPLWLCPGHPHFGATTRRLRARHVNVPVRVLRPGHTRWTRGNALWVSDGFAWRGGLAVWAEDLVQVFWVHRRAATPTEAKTLRRLAADPVVVELTGSDGETLTVAASDTDLIPLLGPFTPDPATSAP